MICERVREQIPECLAGRLDKAGRERVIEHLETCSGCRAELAELGVVWRRLEPLAAPVEEPQAWMKDRFLEMLEAYQAGLAAAGRPAAQPAAGRAWGWWPARPAWQFGLAAALLLLIGLLAGRLAFAPRGENPEMALLKGQVEGLRQLVALSMMQGESAGDRLHGVNYSAEMAQPNTRVEQALLHAATHDPNVNVRLSAVDALHKYAGDAEVRRALVDAVPVQESPLVQIALIDLLVEWNDRDSAGALRQLARDAQTDDAVRQRAAQGMRQLGIREVIAK
jgi:hypothetical protein